MHSRPQFRLHPACCRDHNIRALALHLLSDALGSIAVIVTSLTIWLSNAAWANYLDPICSLLICAITFAVTLPLLKSAAIILMQVRRPALLTASCYA